MEIFLFGGAELKLGHFFPQLKLIEEVIQKISPKQVLHIPFAKTQFTDIECEEDWFNKHIDIKGSQYLNAAIKTDIQQAQDPLIFISGGGRNKALVEGIRTNTNLLKIVKNASYIIGESAGAKILGEYFREKGSDNNSGLIKGLGILKNTIVEPHYTERNRQSLLIKDMEDSGLRYGIGIDCLTVMQFNIDEFPDKYNKIGKGKIEVKIKDE